PTVDLPPPKPSSTEDERGTGPDSQSCNGAAATPPEPEEPPPALQDPEPTVDEAAPSYPPDFEKFWRAARDNPHDFTAWTELLQYVEQENHLPAARKAFDAFFSHYPYCYGYWKKYADMERRFHCGPETEEVRGIPGGAAWEGLGGKHGFCRSFGVLHAAFAMILGCYALIWG
ncbi:pre-mRNA-processing factor 39-like, partial [Oxyura jamaicensis]|uniref:pre-mRNA-processing factor 39-like n=1 Tax=Oxyura jamaicensis TaxID=8884 RepID=UPI0015A5D47B